MSEGYPPEVLTKMNSVIRRIDLICKLFAPVATGFIISFVSLEASAMTLALWNVQSVCLQYWLLISVYNGIPALNERNQTRVSTIQPMEFEETPSTSQERNSLLSDYGDGLEASRNNWRGRMVEQASKIPCFGAWRVYLQQDVVLAGAALALLYFTVLRLIRHADYSSFIIARYVFSLKFLPKYRAA